MKMTRQDRMAGLLAAAKAHGFDSEAELHRLIASVKLETAGQLAAFQRWKSQDGTKAGLLQLDRDPR